MTGRSVLAKLNQMVGAELDRPIEEILAEFALAETVTRLQSLLTDNGLENEETFRHLRALLFKPVE